MIQIFEIVAPLAGVDGDGAIATLKRQGANIKGLFPSLLDTTVIASEGILTLRLRVSGRDRWNTSHQARKIASSMLYRVGVAASTATMDLMSTAPAGNSLTKEQGRSVVNHRPRQSAYKKSRVNSVSAPQDPS